MATHPHGHPLPYLSIVMDIPPHRHPSPWTSTPMDTLPSSYPSPWTFLTTCIPLHGHPSPWTTIPMNIPPPIHLPMDVPLYGHPSPRTSLPMDIRPHGHPFPGPTLCQLGGSIIQGFLTPSIKPVCGHRQLLLNSAAGDMDAVVTMAVSVPSSPRRCHCCWWRGWQGLAGRLGCSLPTSLVPVEPRIWGEPSGHEKGLAFFYWKIQLMVYH